MSRSVPCVDAHAQFAESGLNAALARVALVSASYSVRNATTGSTRDARLAGIQLAKRPAAPSTTTIVT
jgi:hypothetical protein